jgi:tRNA(Ile)-lysidine synthase
VLLVKRMLVVKKAAPGSEKWRRNGDNWTAWLDAGLTAGRLKVRGRREGDRFQPLGMAEGAVKLSDFFINVKLPRRARDRWPLVCAGDEIVWIPGYRIAHRFRVTDKTRWVLKLALRKL